MAKRPDLTGERFGRLVVRELAKVNSTGQASWLCRCDCGYLAIVRADRLRSGWTTSCGCARARKTTKHGHSPRAGSRSPTYQSWTAMKSRCYNPNQGRWADYGGRGIQVCDRWRSSFQNFLADMGERLPGTTLERLDNDGNYEPGNCVWATPTEQQLNTRRRTVPATQREEIRQLYAAGGWSHYTLGSRYGVSHTTIAKIIGQRSSS